MFSQQFKPIGVIATLIYTLAFPPYCFSDCRNQNFSAMSCNMTNAISIQNNLSSTSKLESETPGEQIDFWDLNVIISLQMKKSNISVYAKRQTTDVDLEIDGLNVMEYFVVLRQESKPGRGFLCIFIQTCHKIHIERPSLFRNVKWLVVVYCRIGKTYHHIFKA
jgi:hypothetical protein